MANTHLVIVESPSKAGTIKSYLGSSYKVVASVGHVRDLPKSTMGIDVENNFEPHYINIRGKSEIIKQLKNDAKKADVVYLATDPDREGEAISWHLAATLGIPEDKVNRITFNEISKEAVKAAIKAPRRLDMDLVNSQQARRILDRIVGYKLSPFLWKTVRSGLSAGRVQSAAVKILTERENEIKAFVPKEYWTVTVTLKNHEGKQYTAKFWGDRKKIEPSSEDEVKRILSDLTNDYTVKSVKKSEKIKNPSAPFITSTLQQEAYRKLGFQSSRTMKVAQELYEGINLGSAFGGIHGLITYMRTDSQRVSQSAQSAARDYILSEYGQSYLPDKPRNYKASGNAQDAHEAIRPVSTSYKPNMIRKALTNDQYRLYQLIWDRFIASQMASAVLDTVNADIANGRYIFKASGTTVKFKGYLALYEEGLDNPGDDESDKTSLPELIENTRSGFVAIEPAKHFTEAPPRYNEASLIRFLEEKRIGRPSTYATIISTIIARDYARREGKSLMPTPLAFVTTEVINDYFPEIVDYGFTANMEDSLDNIETGKTTLQGVLNEFYGKFSSELEAAMSDGIKKKTELPPEETDIICDKCGARMIIKSGRFGKFAACPNYPDCKNTKPLSKDGRTEKKTEKKQPEKSDRICEKCGSPLLLRDGKFGRFYACSAFPKCNFTLNVTTDLGVPCPLCGKKVVIKHGKKKLFYGCSGYPECSFSSWDAPTNEKCPKCGAVLYHKKAGNLLVCRTEKCGFKKQSEQ